MDFQDGLNIFIDVTELNTLDVRENNLRARFRDAILDKNHRLQWLLSLYGPWPYGSGHMAMALWPHILVSRTLRNGAVQCL